MLYRATKEKLKSNFSKIVQGQKDKESTVKGNSNSALTFALEIPSSSGTLLLNVCGGDCNITVNNNLKLLEGKCLLKQRLICKIN